MSAGLRIGSLFAGIGGLELGLERAGVGHTVWQVEQNEYARRVLARHWPNAKRYTDVREVGAHNLSPADVVCGGFPCQDLSVAGRQAGLDGARSGLFFELWRIVDELRPRYIVLENVAAILSADDGRAHGRVLGELASSGYDAVWDCVPAASVGAPHIRDRWFLVGWATSGTVPDPEREQLRQLGQRLGQQRDEPRAAEPRLDGAAEHVADSHDPGRREQRRPVAASAQLAAVERGGWWQVEPSVGRVADGIPDRVDRLRALGNAVVPQVAEVVGRVLLSIRADLGAV